MQNNAFPDEINMVSFEMLRKVHTDGENIQNCILNAKKAHTITKKLIKLAARLFTKMMFRKGVESSLPSVTLSITWGYNAKGEFFSPVCVLAGIFCWDLTDQWCTYKA